MTNAHDDVCRYSYVEILAKKQSVSVGNIMLSTGFTEGLKTAGITYGGKGFNIVMADAVLW